MRFLFWIVVSCGIVCVPLATHSQDHVSCVGNSITALSSYPAILDSILGDSVVVTNEGHPGATVQQGTGTSYLQTIAYARLKQSPPDYALVLLGMNDTPWWQWNARAFRIGYGALVDSMLGLPGTPIPWLCLPTPVFDNKLGIDSSLVAQEILPVIDSIASVRGLPTIDLYSPLIAQPSLFPDGVHPSESGAQLIATLIADSLGTRPRIFANKQSVTVRYTPGDSTMPPGTSLTIRNAVPGTTLDSVSWDHSPAWLTVAHAVLNPDSQVFTLRIDTSNIPDLPGSFDDTLRLVSPTPPDTIVISVTLHVREPIAASIAVLPESTVVSFDSTVLFSATLLDSLGEVVSDTGAIIWHSTGGAIDSLGIFTPDTIAGTFPVIATYDSISDTAWVRISRFPLTPPDYLSRLIVLRRNQSPYINLLGASLSPDYLGGEELARPRPGDSTSGLFNGYVWEVVSDNDGVWFDDSLEERFLAYATVYLVADSTTDIRLRYRHDEAVRIWIDDELLVESTVPDQGIEQNTPVYTLTKGLHRVLIKLLDYTGPNHFTLRVTGPFGEQLSNVYVHFDNTRTARFAYRTNHLSGPVIRSKPGGISVLLKDRSGWDLRIGDAMGRTVFLDRIESRHVLVGNERLAPGIYLVSVRTPEGSLYSEKVLIRR